MSTLSHSHLIPNINATRFNATTLGGPVDHITWRDSPQHFISGSTFPNMGYQPVGSGIPAIQINGRCTAPVSGLEPGTPQWHSQREVAPASLNYSVVDVEEQARFIQDAFWSEIARFSPASQTALDTPILTPNVCALTPDVDFLRGSAQTFLYGSVYTSNVSSLTPEMNLLRLPPSVVEQPQFPSPTSSWTAGEEQNFSTYFGPSQPGTSTSGLGLTVDPSLLTQPSLDKPKSGFMKAMLPDLFPDKSGKDAVEEDPFEETAQYSLSPSASSPPMRCAPARKQGRTFSWSGSTQTHSPTKGTSRRRTKSFGTARVKAPSRTIRVDALPVDAKGNIQYPKPVGNMCPIEDCGYVQGTRHKCDLRRHIKAHFDVGRWVCCGVPSQEAARFEIPAAEVEAAVAGSSDQAGLGIKMLRGCGLDFSRKDAYIRHLTSKRRKVGSCRGDANGWWMRASK